MNDEDRILEDIKEILKELDEQGRMKYTQRYMQHSDISVYKHCISVAYTSVELAERFSLNVNRKELIRGALLHDYFLYDWHEKNAGHRFHGFIHAGRPDGKKTSFRGICFLLISFHQCVKKPGWYVWQIRSVHRKRPSSEEFI